MRAINLARKESGNDPVKVLFVAGPTRSGSTIFSNIIGQIEGIFNAGEVIEAWDRGRTWKCSCGQYPGVCEVWSKIFQDINAAISTDDQTEIIRIRNLMSRSHKVIIKHFYPNLKSGHDNNEDIYLRSLAFLYRTIWDKTRASVIVDSSKNIGYCETLSRVGQIDLYVVHLIRDSRATVFSWSKKKEGLWQATPFRMAAEWSSRNIAAEYLNKSKHIKYIKIRYEDFVARPKEVVQSILDFLSISPQKLPFISPNEVMVETSHGLCGNPGRFNRGVERLVADERWKKMKRADKFIATVMTWPLLLKYRYQLFGS